MAEITENDMYYYLNFRARGGWYIARLNGVTFSSRSKVDLVEFVAPINPYLKSGENLLEFIFVPTWNEGGVEWPVGAPNPAFAMRATMRQLNLKTRAEEEFSLTNANFDMETGVLSERERTELGETLSAGRPAFGRVGNLETDTGVYTDIYGPPVDARVMRIRFTIPDEMPPFPWEDAQVVQDTPAFRAELAEAYQAVHGAIASGNFENVFEQYQPAWERSSVTLAYNDARDFAAVNEVQNSLAPIDKDGAVLGPLTFWRTLQTARMEIMAQGRLARFDPAPILWTNPDDPSQRLKSSMVSFYKNRDGRLRMGLVLYGF